MHIFLPEILKSVRWHRSLLVLLSLSMLGGAGCAGSSVGDSLQRSLEADPQLESQTVFVPESSDSDDETAPPSDEAASNGAANPDTQNEAPPEPGNPDFIGPVLSADYEAPAAVPGTSTLARGDDDNLTDVPSDLQPYVADLIALKMLPSPGRSAEAETGFQPNQPITRSDYAQWLFTANNQFYDDQPAKKIRPALSADGAAFEDVPPSHPNYQAIQGLAEAGLIPSALTGNATAVNFRPDAPLTRADLVLWKVPLDTREPLPTATVDAIKETWGFQDAADIEPLALRAVLADYSHGDLSNIARTFGYTTLFQPQKAVTQAEAAATLWRFGDQTEGISAAELLNRSRESDSTSRNGADTP